VQPGSPCDETHPCPAPLVCNEATIRCELASTPIDAPVASDALDAYVQPGCVPVPEICGDGIDQDCNGGDCPPNDTPGGAIDVTAGGNFTANLVFAADDSSRPAQGNFCGGVGGRDVFYKVHLTADETYYIDTFGSDFDTVIRVFDGACTGGQAPSGTHCRDNALLCNQSKQSQGVFDMVAGDNCIVVDQQSSAETTGSLHMRVERGHRTGSPVARGTQMLTGDTTNSADQSTGTCAAAGKDDGYYFTACPGETLTLTATTCNAATLWNTALYLRGPLGQMACNNDDAACVGNAGGSTFTRTVTDNHLFYLIIDSGIAGAVGPYELDTTIQ
jgi:hypothetical protein